MNFICPQAFKSNSTPLADPCLLGGDLERRSRVAQCPGHSETSQAAFSSALQVNSLPVLNRLFIAMMHFIRNCISEAWLTFFCFYPENTQRPGASGQKAMPSESQNGNVALYANDIYFCGSSSGKKPHARPCGSSPVTQRDMRTRNKDMGPEGFQGVACPQHLKHAVAGTRIKSFYPDDILLGESNFFPNLRELGEIKVL